MPDRAGGLAQGERCPPSAHRTDNPHMKSTRRSQCSAPRNLAGVGSPCCRHPHSLLGLWTRVGLDASGRRRRYEDQSCVAWRAHPWAFPLELLAPFGSPDRRPRSTVGSKPLRGRSCGWRLRRIAVSSPGPRCRPIDIVLLAGDRFPAGPVVDRRTVVVGGKPPHIFRAGN